MPASGLYRVMTIPHTVSWTAHIQNACSG